MMACVSSFRPTWGEREFQCRSTSVLAMPLFRSHSLASFPVLLPMEAAVIRAYPREARIAEKFHVMVVLDIRNTRMKDFYDISRVRSHIRHDDLCLAVRCLSTRSSFPIHGIPAKQSL